MVHKYMKEKFKIILSDQFIRISLLLSLVFLLPLVVIILLTYGTLPPLIPFYNSMPWGEERLAYSQVAVFLPVILITLFVVNIAQAMFSYSKYVLVARIVLFNSFLFLLLGLLAYLQILFLTF